MKNYVVIVTLNTANELFATFHKVEDLDIMARATLEVNVNNAQELPLGQLTEDMNERVYPVSSLTPNTIYVFQFDGFDTPVEYNCATGSSSAEEHVMRILGFRKCDNCGAWITPQDIRTGSSTWDRSTSTRLCPTCVAQAEQRTDSRRYISLGGYHTTGNFKVWNEDNTLSDILADGQYLGIEMEVNGEGVSIRNGEFKATEDFYSVANPRSRKRVFHCERDCTVKAEFISNCFTKNSFRAFNWDILTEQTKRMGNDEKYPQVGFHIHLSKTLLGATEQEQVLNFLKLQYVLNKYENDFFKVSGRNSRSEMGYCRFWAIEDIERLRAYASRDNAWGYMPSGHNSALISSGHTIELRICHSTNDSNRIRHTLELVWNLVENIKNVRWEKLWCLSKLFKLVPSETMNYWRRNGAFLNTMAADVRGMSIQASCQSTQAGRQVTYMCIAVFKPAGQKAPTFETLKQCFKRNPDGAGFMVAINDTVAIRKGFMTYSSFEKAYKSFFNGLNDKDYSIVYHFRITTQGGSVPELTHPYPLTRNYAEMRELKSECELGVAHNGIIRLTSEYGVTDRNDTMTFISTYLVDIIHGNHYWSQKAEKVRLVNRLLGNGYPNKLAVLSKTGYCALIGNWIKDNGIYYSNTSYVMPRVPKHKQNTSASSSTHEIADLDLEEMQSLGLFC